MMQRYRTIVADPPWRYGNQGTRNAAGRQYPTMTIDDMQKIVVPADESAHLYLWTTNAFLVEASQLMKWWGFDYKTLLTWVKTQIGMGNYFRNNTEHVLFGVKGKMPTLRRDCPTAFTAPRGPHSQKPDLFYDLVESMSPGPYIELFARRVRLGWDGWGDEWYSEERGVQERTRA
jgi:N6-adenosine-specific RNA methylase IME4